jgi:hypothetical protein
MAPVVALLERTASLLPSKTSRPIGGCERARNTRFSSHTPVVLIEFALKDERIVVGAFPRLRFSSRPRFAAAG